MLEDRGCGGSLGLAVVPSSGYKVAVVVPSSIKVARVAPSSSNQVARVGPSSSNKVAMVLPSSRRMTMMMKGCGRDIVGRRKGGRTGSGLMQVQVLRKAMATRSANHVTSLAMYKNIPGAGRTGVLDVKGKDVSHTGERLVRIVHGWQSHLLMFE